MEGKAGGRHPRAHTFGATVASGKKKAASAELLAVKKKELVRLKKCSVRNLRAEARELMVGEDTIMAAIEGDAPTTTLIKLILKHTKWPEPEPEPEPELEAVDVDGEPPEMSEEERKELDAAMETAKKTEKAGGKTNAVDYRSTAQHVWELMSKLKLRPRPIGANEAEAGAELMEAAEFLSGESVAATKATLQQLCVSIGIVGEPNLGKSSFINALFGSRVVSRSSTPGHTKHLQSMYLNRTTAVIDCPGVVFPKVDVPPGLQVLLGSIPISQLREPYSALRFWAERSVPRLHVAYALGAWGGESGVLEEVADEQDLISAEGGREWANGVEPGKEGGWTPFALAEAMSMKKKFFSRGGRPDLHRAANMMLREALEGQSKYTHRNLISRGVSERLLVVVELPLYFEPPKPEEKSLNLLGEDDEQELRELRQRQAERATAAAAVAKTDETVPMTPRETAGGGARPTTPRDAAEKKPLTAAEKLREEARERREMQEEMERYDREMMEEEAGQ